LRYWNGFYRSFLEATHGYINDKLITRSKLKIKTSINEET